MMAVLASLFGPGKFFCFFLHWLCPVRLNFTDLISWHLSFLILIRSGQRVLLAEEKITSSERTDWDIISNVPSLLPGKIA